jgi:sugar phosphate isomerase/epimerase
MNKIAVSSNTYHGFSVEDALQGIAAAGFKYVELTAVKNWTEHIMADMPKSRLEEIKALMKELGLGCIALSGHCNLLEEDRLADFEKNIDLAAYLGCAFIVSSTGEAHFGKDEIFSNEILVQNLRRVLKRCEQHNLKLVLELHGQYATGEKMKELCLAVGSENIGINYDTGNVVLYGGKYPEDDVKTCYDRVLFCHLKDKSGAAKDWNFPAVGKGDLKLKEFMTYLIGKGYAGPFSIEIEYEQEFCMREKTKEDLPIVNKAVKDSYDYLHSIGMINQ